MKKAMQLYCVRDYCERDFEGTLTRLAEMGFEGVEFEKFFDLKADQIRSWMDRYHLEPAGSHTSIEELTYRLDWVMDYNRTLGNTRIVCRSSEIQNGTEARALADLLRPVALRLRENGMTLSYHNHSTEMRREDGRLLLDILAERLPELELQLDLHWVYSGGGDYHALLKQYAGRMDTFHIRDGGKGPILPFGEGEMDLEGILRRTREQGFSWMIVEALAEPDGDWFTIPGLDRLFSLYNRI